MSELSNLYQKVILQHNDNPYHYEKREQADQVIEAYNPLCGDQFKLYLNIEDGKVTSAYFHGYGCAISKASTSILIQRLEGCKLEKIPALCEQFFTYVLPGQSPKTPIDMDFQAFEAAKKFSGRLKCATLSWDEMYRSAKKSGDNG